MPRPNLRNSREKNLKNFLKIADEDLRVGNFVAGLALGIAAGETKKAARADTENSK